MKKSICGIDCEKCESNKLCKGCVATKGKPFGGECVVAKCANVKKIKNCDNCLDKICNLKNELIKEFNNLKIKDMPKVKELNSLQGSFVNVEYMLSNGQKIKLLDDKKIYLGNQLPKENTKRCYGIVGDEKNILVCEYGKNGSKPEIIIYKKR